MKHKVWSNGVSLFLHNWVDGRRDTIQGSGFRCFQFQKDLVYIKLKGLNIIKPKLEALT